jgi:hypothetical protein
MSVLATDGLESCYGVGGLFRAVDGFLLQHFVLPPLLRQALRGLCKVGQVLQVMGRLIEDRSTLEADPAAHGPAPTKAHPPEHTPYKGGSKNKDMLKTLNLDVWPLEWPAQVQGVSTSDSTTPLP